MTNLQQGTEHREMVNHACWFGGEQIDLLLRMKITYRSRRGRVERMAGRYTAGHRTACTSCSRAEMVHQSDQPRMACVSIPTQHKENE